MPRPSAAPRAATTAALSGDAALLGRVRSEGFAAEVHSVFDRVINLRPVGVQRLCCVAARDVDDAPDTLRLDVGSCRELRLRPGDCVTGRGSGLDTPAGHIDTVGAQPWEPRLPGLPIPGLSLAWLRGFLGHRAVGVGSGVPEDPWQAVVRPLLDRHLGMLLDAVRRGDAAGTARSADRMIGLGAGLTPSGDDVLVGVTLVAAMANSALAPARDVLVDVVERNAARTNEISHATLAQAATGRVRESVAGLLRAMAHGGTDRRLDGHGTRVAAIGHTSGIDILTGLSAALDLDHELQGDR